MFLIVFFQEEATKSWDVEILVALITFLAVLIGNIITIWANIIQNKKTLKDNNNKIKRADFENEKDSYIKKLNEFYIPLRHYLENSKTLFKIFKKDKPKDFRTLTYLLKPNQKYDGKKVKLNKNDKALLNRIFNIGSEIENLILKNSYLAGNDLEFISDYKPRDKYAQISYEKNMTLLSLLISHLIVIRMAYEQDLSGQMKKFEGFVFPNEINVRVEEKIKELNRLILDCENNMDSLLN
tara:strand:+ start:2565 stop:3281 length:717 start_codon:yes stop_codon:yes gene_type:complete